MSRRRRFALVLLLLGPLAAAADTRVTVGSFADQGLAQWEERRFAGQTDYRMVAVDGRRALRARSDGAASGLFREIQVDLTETPYLHWSWRVENTLGPLKERTRDGDDYPARVYVVFSGGLFFWRTRAINYVWSNHQPVGTAWPNAFTDNARMIAVRSGDDRLGEWVSQRRDVRADYRRLFGDDIATVDAVALMTDTDNSGGRATAYYGDIYFAAE